MVVSFVILVVLSVINVVVSFVLRLREVLAEEGI